MEISRKGEGGGTTCLTKALKKNLINDKSIKKSTRLDIYKRCIFFELEKSKLILKNWQLVCHISEYSNPGDFFTFEIFNERIFVIRGEKGDVSAFQNFCSIVVQKLIDEISGTCNGKITCPYHAWGYDFKGNLIKVPYEDQFKDFNKKNHGLQKVDLEIFQGFFLLNC